MLFKLLTDTIFNYKVNDLLTAAIRVFYKNSLPFVYINDNLCNKFHISARKVCVVLQWLYILYNLIIHVLLTTFLRL